MKAVHVSSPGHVELADLPRPEPAPGEALLRVRYAGVCGSDLQTFTGNQPFATYPRIPGHEFSAELVEINGEAPGLEQGMLVTGNPYFNCGSCSPCRRGLVNCCESNETMGVHRDGAFCEYLTLPIERVYPGESLSAQQLAMIEPFSIGFHAATQARVAPGDRVLVLGAGAIGIFALLSAKLLGASVWIADILPSRLEIAQRMGADGTILLTEVEDLGATARELTDDNGFDVALEATGVPESFLNAMAASMYGGRIALIGNGKREVSFNQSLIIKKELTILGSRNSLDAFRPLIRHVAAGDVDIEGMHTATYPFPQTIDAMQDLLAHPENNVKVLISF
ncbi:MAG TPA: zinc-binding alcohol dehydrogenase family protein [Propionibacteriaceae bacterium]|jgi:threonine dehydrogenase-like Zn-dependent dehydrogenase